MRRLHLEGQGASAEEGDAKAGGDLVCIEGGDDGEGSKSVMRLDLNPKTPLRINQLDIISQAPSNQDFFNCAQQRLKNY